MADEIADAEKLIAEWTDELAVIEASLETNPNDEDALERQAQLLEGIAEIEEFIATKKAEAGQSAANVTGAVSEPVPEPTVKPSAELAIKPTSEAASKLTTESATVTATTPATKVVVESIEKPTADDLPPPPPTDANGAVPSPPPRASTEGTPEQQAANVQAKKAPIVPYNVGDTVLAMWSEDHKFYTASIITKSGSSANPQYYVKFKDYEEYAYVPHKHVRPTYQAANAAKKRKAEEDLSKTTATPNTPTRNSAAVITAGPTYFKKSEEPTAKKQKTGEERKTTFGTSSKLYKNMDAKGLETQRSSWEEWQNNSKWAKKNKTESMFRVGDSHKARVGFVGSGKEMTKGPDRKHGYRKKDVEQMKKLRQEDDDAYD